MKVFYLNKLNLNRPLHVRVDILLGIVNIISKKNHNNYSCSRKLLLMPLNLPQPKGSSCESEQNQSYQRLPDHSGMFIFFRSWKYLQIISYFCY